MYQPRKLPRPGYVGRPFFGYAVGAMVPVLMFSALYASVWPIALAVGAVVAFMVGCLFVFPIVAVLEHFGQIRVWWAALVGYLIFVLPVSVVSYQEGFWLGLLLLMRDPAGVIALDNELLALAVLGTLGSLIGWVVAYGFRVRPKEPSDSLTRRD